MCPAQHRRSRPKAQLGSGMGRLFVLCPQTSPAWVPSSHRARGYGLQGTQPLGLRGPFPSAWVLTSVLLFHSFSKYSRITWYLAREAWRMAVPFTEMGRSEAGGVQGKNPEFLLASGGCRAGVWLGVEGSSRYRLGAGCLLLKIKFYWYTATPIPMASFTTDCGPQSRKYLIL